MKEKSEIFSEIFFKSLITNYINLLLRGEDLNNNNNLHINAASQKFNNISTESSLFYLELLFNLNLSRLRILNKSSWFLKPIENTEL